MKRQITKDLTSVIELLDQAICDTSKELFTGVEPTISKALLVWHLFSLGLLIAMAYLVRLVT